MNSHTANCWNLAPTVPISGLDRPAGDTAIAPSRRSVLIDGDHLARLMIRYGIGVRIEETFHFKKIDEDVFTIDV